jgi:hypothetical protein
MTLILTLISVLAGSLTSFLAKNGTITDPFAALVNASVAAGEALFAALKGGGGVTTEVQVTAAVQAALTALEAELAAIQQDTTLDPADVAIFAELTGLVQAAVKGFSDAESGNVDPSTLPVPPAVE